MQAIFAASDRPYPEKVRLNRIKALNGLLAEVPVPKELLDDPRCTVRDRGPGRASGCSTATSRWSSTACIAAS